MNIRNILANEYEVLGQMMVDVYSNLDGFPTQLEQPGYYKMLANIGKFSEKKNSQVLVAISNQQKLVGGVVYISEMADYGSGGMATSERNASGIRLLGVDRGSRGAGVGKALTQACIQLAMNKHHSHVILHTTQAMQTAWRLYQSMGFKRAEDLDFLQEKLQVYGFRLQLAIN